MGQLYTPLTNTPVNDWFEKPDVPQSSLSSLTILERYGNVVVTDAVDRDTRIPTVNRHVGQVTYNTANDTFEYWNGTAWAPVNTASSMPSSLGMGADVSIAVAANKYYDYTAKLNITQACMVRLEGTACCRVHCTTAQWQGFSVQTIHNTTIGVQAPRWVMGYPNQSATFWGTVPVMSRFTCSPGAHTFGIRVTALNGSGDGVIENLSLQLTRLSPNANSNAGNNANGFW